MDETESIYDVGNNVKIKVYREGSGIVIRVMSINAGDLVVIPRAANTVFVTAEKRIKRDKE